MDKLIAFNVYEGSPQEGCLLVFASSRNQARSHAAHRSIFSLIWEYQHLHARRMPEYDQYAKDQDQPYSVETNQQLPEAAPTFYDLEQGSDHGNHHKSS